MAALARTAFPDTPSDDGFDHRLVAVAEPQPHIAIQTGTSRSTQYVQYIRALNDQFSSWVQKQLKEHPHELWQDGVQDYLRHASKIENDFKDVVVSCSSSTGVESRLVQTAPTFPSDLKERDTGFSLTATEKSMPQNVFLGRPSTLHIFNSFPAVAPSAGLPILNIPNQSSNNGNEMEDDDDAPPEPSSPSLKRTDEPGVKSVHEIKCKLYIQVEADSDKVWKEMGMGNLTLRVREDAVKGTKAAKATVVVRNEVGRILLNALLYSNMKMNLQKNTVTSIFYSAEADVKTALGEEHDAMKPRLYLFKLRTPNDAQQLVDVLSSNAPKE